MTQDVFIRRDVFFFVERSRTREKRSRGKTILKPIFLLLGVELCGESENGWNEVYWKIYVRERSEKKVFWRKKSHFY